MPPGLINRAVKALEQGDLALAETALRAACEINAPDARLLALLHTTLMQAGRYSDALIPISEALTLEPQDPDLMLAKALNFEGLGRLSEALDMIGQSLATRPNWPAALAQEASVLRLMGHGDQAVDRLRALSKVIPENASVWGKLILALQGDARATLGDIAETTRRVWNLHEAVKPAQVHTTPTPDKRLKIAYVSGDFREHPVAYFLEGVLTAHDRNSFHITLVPTIAGADGRTDSLRNSADD